MFHARTDFDGAIALLRQAVSLCEGGTIPIYFTRVLSGLGSALCVSGDAEGGLRLLERALDEASQMNFVYGYSLILLQRARAFLDVGRLHEAQAGAAEPSRCPGSGPSEERRLGPFCSTARSRRCACRRNQNGRARGSTKPSRLAASSGCGQ